MATKKEMKATRLVMLDGALASFTRQPNIKSLAYLITCANKYWLNHGSDSP